MEEPALENRVETPRPPRPLLARRRGEAQRARATIARRDAGGRVSETERRAPLVEVQHLKKYFPIRKGVLSARGRARARRRRRELAVARARRSASSASRAAASRRSAATIVRLLEPTAGEIVFEGTRSRKLGARALRPLRREMQMVFQDPYASLNPRKRVGSIIGDPLKIHGIGDRKRAQGGASRSCSRRSASRRSTTTASRTSSRAASASGSGSRARSRCGRS